MKKTAPLALTHNLIRLERGGGELILANSARLNPLYVRSGREYVENVLKRIPELNTRGRLERAFPRDHRLISALIDHRILVPAKDQADGKDRAEPETHNLPSGPSRGITLYLLMSQSCNLRCAYCFNGARTYAKQDKKLMAPDTAARAAAFALERLDARGRLQIAFFGGEPLLNWPVIKHTIAACERDLKPNHPHARILYHITTNLTLFPNDLIEWALRHHVTFLVNLDGPAAIHDRLRPYKNGRPSHGRTAANVKALRAAGVPVYLRSTVTALNQGRMNAVVKHHHRLGGVSTALVPISPITSDEEYLPEDMLPDPDRVIAGLEEVYANGVWPSDRIFPFTTYAGKVRPGSLLVAGCGAPYGNTYAVTASGDLYPCSSLAGIPRFHLGNVRDPAAPDRSVMARMMDRLHVDRDPECRDCVWRYLCGGGCPVWKLLILDDPECSESVKNYVRAINCRFTPKVLELLMWEMAGEAGQRISEAAADRPKGVLDETIFC